MALLIRKFKIKGLPTDKEFAGMLFGRQIEHLRAIATFKAEAKSTHVSQKRTTNAKAIRETVALHDATEFYCEFHDGPDVRDDVFEFWYRSNP